MSNGQPWSVEEHDQLRLLYPGMSTKDLAHQMGRPLGGVYSQANILGLHKSAEYLAGPEACRLRRGDNVGIEYRFKPGIVPVNKGLRRPGWAPGRMAETQFKKGQVGNKRMPLGTTRFSKDGYLERKVREWSYPPRCWVGEHVLLWERMNGAVPAGHAVTFKDGHKRNIALENLELVSRRELMLRNTVHRLPKDLALAIQMNGALKRKLRRLSEKQDDGSAQPSL